MNEQRDQTDANSYSDGDKEEEVQLSRLESLCTFADNVQTIADRDDDMEKGVTTGHVAPDGGFEAWLQVFGGVLIAVNTWGLINMWGTFQTYYSSQTPPLASGSAISWIGSIQSFLLLFVGALCGRPFDLGYSKHMTWSGSAIMTIAILLTSLSGEFGGHRGNQVYYQVLLSQGVLLGLGMGLTLIPQVAIVSSYFTSKRGLAVSIVTVGGSVGGVIYPIVFRRLVVKVGFHWSMRIFALIVCVGLVSASLILKQRKDIIDRRVKDEESQGFIRRLVSVLKFLKSITWRDWPYLVYVFAMFWTSMCLYCPFYYIERFTIDAGMDMKGLDTVYLISIMNAGGAFGRVVAGLLADVLGPVTTQLIFILLGTITLFSWLSITTVAPLIAFSALYGFFAGAIIALPPASIAKLTSNISVLGTRLGVMFLAYGLATLSGPPIAGRLAGMGGKKGESAAKIYLGAVMLTAGVVIAWSRWLKVGCSLKKAI